jgi:hypothetical protein
MTSCSFEPPTGTRQIRRPRVASRVPCPGSYRPGNHSLGSNWLTQAAISRAAARSGLCAQALACGRAGRRVRELPDTVTDCLNH